MYTIRDVARLAQVSTATVSFVSNGKAHVSEPLRRRVLDAMKALDYQPNQVARSLQARRTHIIGMVVPQLTNAFFGEIMRGVEDRARQSSYSVIFCDSEEDPELERQHLNTLFARRVDGVLISSSNGLPQPEHSVMQRFPVVFVDRTPPRFSGTAVVSDNLGASREATHHLIALGHTRIAIITGPPDLPICSNRLEGFRWAMTKAHLRVADEYLKRGDFKWESGYRHGRELMQLTHPPTAIFCCNISMTLGLMRALTELNIPCPERVSVLGFDDFEWVASFRPQLTTVAQPTYEMGARATEILVRKMKQEKGEGENCDEQVTVLPNQLRIRESTAPPPPGPAPSARRRVSRPAQSDKAARHEDIGATRNSKAPNSLVSSG
jgi:DNA-binding LacI/PurR family transcriptional regulator